MTREDLEMMFIGGILESPDGINIALEKINPVYFTPKMKRIWEVILNIHVSGHRINMLNMMTEIEKRYHGLLSSSILQKCITMYRMSENMEQIILQIKEKYAIDKFRQEIRALDSKIGRSNLNTLIENHKARLEKLASLYEEKSNPVSTLIDSAVEKLRDGNQVIKFGLSYMDDFSGGLTRGEISAIGGRPGHGKTTFALFLAKTLAENGFKVLFINRELKNEAALEKLLIMESDKLTVNDFRLSEISSETLAEIERVKEIIKNKYNNLIFVDNIGSLSESISEIRKIKPDVFFDDYIQMIRTEYDTTKEKRFIIEDIMFSYKWIAKELNITGVVLSQLSREIEKRIDKTPVMSDLAEGASIEHYSENVIFIKRDTDNKVISHLVIDKSRWGIPGIYQIGARLEKCTYYETVEEALKI